MEPDMSGDKKTKGTGLRFIPVNDFSLIPRGLVEQIKPREYNVERLYELGPEICRNPLNILGVFAPMDESAPDHGVVKGFLWAGVNPLDEKIHVYALSLARDRQGRGIMNEARNILEKIRVGKGLKGITFSTTRPRAFEKLGISRSPSILMEV